MQPDDVLTILSSNNLPHRVRCLAQGLFTAMLALERYGHTLSYAPDAEGLSEADRDGGLIARRALEDIRFVERRMTLNRISGLAADSKRVDVA